ncbi:MAG: 3-hydroxyacyl-CoA dehydrogenase NAD-binding domain-containing protein [Chloroflexota bacterium]|nr:3-hydroxyacyl-CoA dehydrogenase NAD-binding domain-containing protein [Chloroflexota bacterium]
MTETQDAAVEAVRRATVVGAGTMGSGIAQVLAAAEIEVTLVDVSTDQLQRAQDTIARSLDRLLRRGDAPAGRLEEILGRIRCTPHLDASIGPDLLVEAVVEDLAAKQAVLQQAAAVLSETTVLASNTSSISITALASAVPGPERVVGMHFFNPVPVMSLVEVVRGARTSPEALGAVVALAQRLGKSPVVVEDYPGFVSNRILLPMLNEAIFALMEGVAEKEAIDEVMRLGMHHPMGPLQLADFIGLDVCLHILEVLHRDLGDDKYRPCPLLRRMVAAGLLGRKSGAGFYTYTTGAPPGAPLGAPPGVQ